MKLWRKAAGLLKDQNSIWIANLFKRPLYRNPDIDQAVIKATSHDETHLDYRNTQRVFSWLHMSPSFLKPLIWSISVRMEKTHSWVVALKGLMLIHGVFASKPHIVQRIGRLPFDLSKFKDAYSDTTQTWAYNAFICDYYSFLDKKSTYIFLHAQELKAPEKGELDQKQQRQSTLNQELVWLKNLEDLLDMLLQIRPQCKEIIGVLILEAMNCIITEIMEIYSSICNGISRIMMKISSSSLGKEEAEKTLNIALKTSIQQGVLAAYFEFCKDIGVLNASESPRFDQIPEEIIRELETIVNNGAPEIKYSDLEEEVEEEESITVEMIESMGHQRKDSTTSLHTTVTNAQERFDENPKKTADFKPAADDH